MITISLPWPDAKLSPNGREHWAAKKDVVKAARTYAWALALEVMVAQPAYVSTEIPLAVRFDFYPPNKRHFDLDNLVARMKAAQDGIFDALGINDRKITRIEANRLGVVKCGKVVITVEPKSDGREMEF